jgi:hypothetical protein
MNVEILTHDVDTGAARIRFTHNDVVLEDNYNLKMIIPGSVKVLEALGQSFTEEMQLTALGSLTAWIQRDIEAGIIKNRPE